MVELSSPPPHQGLSAQLWGVWSADSLWQVALWATSAAENRFPEVTHFPGWPTFSETARRIDRPATSANTGHCWLETRTPQFPAASMEACQVCMAVQLLPLPKHASSPDLLQVIVPINTLHLKLHVSLASRASKLPHSSYLLWRYDLGQRKT